MGLGCGGRWIRIKMGSMIACLYWSGNGDNDDHDDHHHYSHSYPIIFIEIRCPPLTIESHITRANITTNLILLHSGIRKSEGNKTNGW